MRDGLLFWNRSGNSGAELKVSKKNDIYRVTRRMLLRANGISLARLAIFLKPTYYLKRTINKIYKKAFEIIIHSNRVIYDIFFLKCPQSGLWHYYHSNHRDFINSPSSPVYIHPMILEFFNYFCQFLVFSYRFPVLRINLQSCSQKRIKSFSESCGPLFYYCYDILNC